MRRVLLTAILLILQFNICYSCDFCNCYLGLNPHYKKNTISLRYTYNAYSGTHLTNADLKILGLSKSDFSETRTRGEVYGQVYPSQKTQIIYSIPFLVNRETMSDKALGVFNAPEQTISDHHHGAAGTTEEVEKTETVQGIGDPVVLMNYQVFNYLPEEDNGIAQRLFAGGGFVLPFGRYKTDVADPLERSHLPGGGSLRMMVSTTYLAKKGKWGMNSSVSYLFANKNRQNFSLGATLNANATFYYQVHHNNTDLFPSAGIYTEYAQRNTYEGKSLTSTGGVITYMHSGLDFYFKRIALTTGFQIPIIQRLYENQPMMRYRLICSLAFVI